MGRGLINSGGVVCGTDSLRMELEGSTGNSAVWEGGGYCVKSTIHTCNWMSTVWTEVCAYIL